MIRMVPVKFEECGIFKDVLSYRMVKFGSVVGWFVLCNPGFTSLSLENTLRQNESEYDVPQFLFDDRTEMKKMMKVYDEKLRTEKRVKKLLVDLIWDNINRIYYKPKEKWLS